MCQLSNAIEQLSELIAKLYLTVRFYQLVMSKVSSDCGKT